jgi:hypothetical protein
MPKSKRHRRPDTLARKMPDIEAPHGTRRVIAYLFGFCRRCDNVHCRRANKCVGEAAPCFDAYWPDVPEILKDLFREIIRARQAGAVTPEEIQNAAFAKIMAYYTPEQIRAAAANIAPQKASRGPAMPDAPPAPPPPVLPRARIL